jgi:hypothetical protein
MEYYQDLFLIAEFRPYPSAHCEEAIIIQDLFDCNKFTCEL